MILNEYIGLPYKDNGREKDGLDCWGLARLYYKEVLNIDLPSYSTEYSGQTNENIKELITQHKDSWIEIEKPVPGDLALFNILGEPTHVGVYIGENKFLHVREGKDSVIESLLSQQWNKRFVGFYRYSEKQLIQISGVPHPLRTIVLKDWTVAGTNIEEFTKFIQDKYQVSERLLSKIVIMIDGIPIPKEDWKTTILKPGQNVAYRAIPGKDAGRAILMVAVMVVAMHIGPMALGLEAGTGSAAVGTALEAGGMSASFAYYGAIAAVQMAGMALINAIMPIRPPSDNRNDPGSPNGLNLFSGASNQANRFGAIPIVLGKMRMTAMLGAVPYVEPLTDTSLITSLLVWGFGPLSITDMCIGTKSLATFYGTDSTQTAPSEKTLYGYANEIGSADEKSFNTMYAKDVQQQFPQKELFNNIDDGNDWETVIFDSTCEKIDVTFSFPEGMRGVVIKDGNGKASGDIVEATTAVEIQVAKYIPGQAIAWVALPTYSTGTTGSYVVTLPGMFFTENEAQVGLYRWTIFALATGGGIKRFDGFPTDSEYGEPSEELILKYKGNSLAGLVGLTSDFTRLPKIPTDHIPLYRVCVFGDLGTTVTTDLRPSVGYRSGLDLTYQNESGNLDIKTGQSIVTITSGSITGTGLFSGANVAGIVQNIFNARIDLLGSATTAGVGGATITQTDGITVSLPGNAGHSQFLRDNAIYSSVHNGSDYSVFDRSKSITFPATGYYEFKVSGDDTVSVFIEGARVIHVPSPAAAEPGVTQMVYIEAGSKLLRLVSENAAQDYLPANQNYAGVACTITYTENGVMNNLPTSNTILTFGTPGLFEKYKDAFNFTYRINQLDPFRYAVRAKRINSDIVEPTSYIHKYHRVSLFCVTGYSNVSAVTVNPNGCYLAKTIIRIQSSNKVNGTVDGVNALVHTLGKEWNGTNWINNQTINNPASLFLHVLLHPANAYRIAEADMATNIDLSTIQEWHTYCNTNAFTYNNVITNTQSVMSVLRDIAAAGKASPNYVDGKWTVVIDKPRTHTVQYFTPHNSWGFEATKILPKIPDAFRIIIPNEERVYQQDEIRVYNYGYNELGTNGKTAAKLFEEISLPGVTNVAQAQHFGRWHFAQLKLRPEIYTLTTDFEYLICSRGDLVKVSHDVPLWGTGTGRIKAFANNSAIVTLTEPVYLEVGKTYRILIRTNNLSTTVGSGSITKTITTITNSTWYTQVTLTTNIISGDLVEIDNLFIIGESNHETQDLIVIGIETLDNMGARISLVDYSPSIYTDNLEANLLVYNANITGAATSILQTSINVSPTITGTNSDSAISQEISNGNYQNILKISIGPPIGTTNIDTLVRTATRIQLQIILGDAYFENTSDSFNQYINKEVSSYTAVGLKTDRLYKIRARYTNDTGSVCGPWSNIYYTSIIGKSQNTHTSPVISLDLQGTYIIASPSIDLNKPSDFKYYEYRLYKDTGSEDFWELDTTTNNILINTSQEEGKFDLTKVTGTKISNTGITYRVACRTVDRTNNYNAESALGTIVVKTII